MEMSYLEVAPQLCMEQCQLEGPSHGSLRYWGWGQVPVAEEVVVVVGAEAALRALFLPVDAGGVDEGTKHGWSRQPSFGEEGTESGCLLVCFTHCPRGDSTPPGAPASL